MPNLLGENLDDAKKALTDNGLVSGKVTPKESDEYFSGQVMGQSVSPDTQILEGGTVDLTVSSGPGPAAQIAQVTYEIPDDGQEHRLQILVTDKKGAHYEYDQVHQPKDLIVQDIPFYGSGKVKVYLDGNLVDSQNIPVGG